MTITLNVRVNGDYRATVVPTVEGQPSGEAIYVDGPNGDALVYFQHGKTNTFVISEESLADVRAREMNGDQPTEGDQPTDESA